MLRSFLPRRRHHGHSWPASRQRAEEVAASAREQGVKAVAIGADIGTDEAARGLVDEAVQALGGLDILINNAAITRFIPIDDLEGVDDEAWDAIFQTNVLGLFYVSRAAAPHLKASGDGVIVNIGSVAGIGDQGSSIPYCASKAAVHSLTRTLARALAPEVRVNCVAPGFIDTEWHAAALNPEQLEARRRSTREGTLLKKVCQPEDVADAIVAFVVHNHLATGQVLQLHGGRAV